MTAPITISELVSHPQLLGPWFAGDSWDVWRAVLRAAYALPLSEPDIALFRSVAERDPPAKPVRELVAVVGRRGGKDSVASAIATHAALGDYSALLRPGEMASVVCIACDRDQAAIVLRYIRGYFTAVPMLRAMVARETLDGLQLTNGVEIIVATNDYRSVRGRSVICAILDEAAFYARDGNASSDKELYAALVPSLSTLPGSMLVVISSPHMKDGLLYDKWSKHYGRPDERVLVVRGASRVFNPSLDQAVIDEDLAADPQRAAAEWLAEWRADLNTFIDPEMIEAAVERGVPVLPPRSGVSYKGFCDSSSGRGDSFVVAVAHREGDKVVQDAVCEWRAPFNAAAVLGEAAAFLKSYGLREVTGDRYSVGFVVAGFAQHGITYRETIKVTVDGKERSLDRSAIYLNALPLFTSGRAVLRDHQRTVRQFIALERRTYPTGLDKVQHPANGADDCCNAVAGALVLAAQRLGGIELMRRLGGGDGRPPRSASSAGQPVPVADVAAVEARIREKILAEMAAR